MRALKWRLRSGDVVTTGRALRQSIEEERFSSDGQVESLRNQVYELVRLVEAMADAMPEESQRKIAESIYRIEDPA